MNPDKKLVVRTRGIIIDIHGALLVVKHAHDASFACLPGGHLEWGEDVKQCLERELIEELGVKPEIGRLLYVNNFIEKDVKQSIEFFFEILNAHEYKDIEHLERTHAFEVSEIIWVQSSDALSIMPKQFGQDFKEGKILSSETKFIFT